ncbi:flavodoxin [Lachnotalea sp. AF33-28]|uniref:flavodoxin n=1 Tax=Lachnotalea sp. AF33-28 TaxID=2292046 RepID=UPI000E4E1E44|nr:flavodoxin [Lachnotalea sp. AF33-28]RHP30972.1 flavodoxin [Lachnotalea sp. AF33-28]
MKKILAFVLILTMVFALAACGNSNSSESDSSQGGSSAALSQTEPSSTPEETPSSSEDVTQTEEPSESEPEAGSNALVVYFSWSGNTEAVANEIAAQTGADVFEITPAEPYTDDYDTLLDIAQEEKASDARPAIAETVEDFAQYDVVYFGFPNWWGDMPMILYTFLDDYDFSGKTIAPFVTSGGSGFSSTISAIESLEPDATVVDGLSLSSSAAAEPSDEVTEWLSPAGLTE